MVVSPRSLLLLLPVAWGGWACDTRDPILDRAEEMAGQQQVARGAQPGQMAPGGPAQPGPQQAGAPAPGKPGDPPPGIPEEPAPAQPGAGGHQGGPAVTLKGRIDVPGHSSGAIRVDVFDGDQRAAAGSDKRPSVVAMARLDGPGEFSVRVPKSAGKVWIGAFADVDGDGRPGPNDPSAWYGDNPVKTSSDADDLVLTLEARPPPSDELD